MPLFKKEDEEPVEVETTEAEVVEQVDPGIERFLAVHIDVTSNDFSWSKDYNVPLPEHLPSGDELHAFIAHSIDIASARIQQENLGFTRAATFLRAYSKRMEAIAHFLETAPHDIRTSATAAWIRQVMDADNNTIFATYGDGVIEEA